MNICIEAVDVHIEVIIGSAKALPIIVREVQSVRERERYRERQTEVTSSLSR